MRRVVVPELLDEDQGTPQEVAESLADLRMLNRHFGGITTMAALLRRASVQSGMREFSFLDVAGTSGDVALGARNLLVRSGITFDITVLDRSRSHLPTKTEAVPICGSALQLPFADASFDFVGCSLFLHHLEPDEIPLFLIEALRVCRRAVLISDLRRGWFHWFAALAGRLIYRSALTRHDAPASVRRAYTQAELAAIFSRAGYPTVRFSHHFFCRLGILVWRKDEV